MEENRSGLSRLGLALNSKSVIILLFVGLWMNCAAEAPKITDFTYRFKQLELLDSVLDAISVTAKFDQEVFHNVTCSDPSEQEPAIFSPCCTFSNDTGCVSSSYNDVLCMDFAHPSLNNSIVYDQLLYYYTRVENYATCHSITIENHARLGLGYLMVSVRGDPYPAYNTADFLGATYGSAAQSMCCSEIRRRNPSWTGNIYFGVVGSAPSIVDIRLWNDTKLPIDRFWHQPPVTVTCDGFQFSAKDCLNNIGCFFTPPTSDPLFDLAKLISSIDFVTATPLQYSVGIITRQVQFRNLENANVIFPFPTSRLQDSSCRYSFPTIVNSAGEPVESVPPPSFKYVECNKEAYNNNVELFRMYVENLGQTETVSFADAGVALLKVLPFVVSDEWVACNELVERDFLKQSTEQINVLQTKECYETYTSASYLNDSCCNPDLQLVECCAPRDVIATTDRYEIIADNVQAACSAYRCSLNNLGDYMVLSASSADRRSGCATRSTEATNAIFTSRNGLFACIQNFQPQYCNYDVQCRSVDINSICLPSHYCSIPCSKDEDCITGTCTTFPFTNITTCQTLTTNELALLNDTGLMDLGLQCMEFHLDEIILFFIKQNQGLQVTSSRNELIQALIANGTQATCQGIAPAATEEDCKAVQTCNWLPCDSQTNQYCNQQNCTTPLLGSSNFCATCEAGFCIEVSTFGHCEYTSLNSDATNCAVVGGSFNGLSYSPLVSTRCLAPATTQDTCYDPQYCSSASAACASKCYVSGVTSQAQCDTVGQISSQTPQWIGWTRGAVGYGLCTVSINSYSSCVAADSRLRYWPGSTWTSPLFSSQEFCEAFGRCDTLTGLYTQESCEELSHCVGNEALTNQQSCEAPGSCNDFDGCVFPLRENSFDCEMPLRWTPIGCQDLALTTQGLCGTANGTWVTRSTTREACLAKASICFEPPSAGLLSNRPRGGEQTPTDYTFKSAEECEACNGVHGTYYSWRQQYYWAPRQYSKFQWKTREMVPGNYWIRAPSPSYFFAIVQAAVGKRFAKILESEQLCRYAQIQASLQGIVCDCTNSGTTDCYDGFSSSVVALAAFCSSIPDSFSEGPVSLSCADDFKVQDTDCLDIKISVIPISQFESRGVSSLSAASISSSRADQRRSALYIKNGAGVAVGQVLSSGSKVETDRSFIGTITVCLTFPADFTSDLPLQLYDYAVPNEDYTQFTPLGMTDVVKPNGTFCFGLVNNSITYFPIGLQENWENAPFISTYFPAEVFYLFFGAIMYLLVLAFTMYHFAVHIRMREVGRPFFNLSTAALLILIIFLMNRFIYMMLIVSGVMDSNGEVEVVFSSFPALLFYVIYSIIVLRWAEIYHFTIEAGQRGGLTKLKPAIIAMNAFLSFAFVLLLILYFTLDDHTPQVINCATPDTELDQMTRGDIVAIIYKVFFATVSVILSVLFVTYGVRVMQLVLKSLKSENVHLQKREARVRAFQKLLVVSCVCTLCLLAQAAFLLWSSVSVASTDEQQQFYGILSFLYATEIPSSIIFVLMFKKASFFIKAGRHGNLAGSTASTSAPTNSYQPMSSMHSATA